MRWLALRGIVVCEMQCRRWYYMVDSLMRSEAYLEVPFAPPPLNHVIKSRGCTYKVPMLCSNHVTSLQRHVACIPGQYARALWYMGVSLMACFAYPTPNLGAGRRNSRCEDGRDIPTWNRLWLTGRVKCSAWGSADIFLFLYRSDDSPITHYLPQCW